MSTLAIHCSNVPTYNVYTVALFQCNLYVLDSYQYTVVADTHFRAMSCYRLLYITHSTVTKRGFSSSTEKHLRKGQYSSSLFYHFLQNSTQTIVGHTKSAKTAHTHAPDCTFSTRYSRRQFVRMRRNPPPDCRGNASQASYTQ